jgi:hypothetical protein
MGKAPETSLEHDVQEIVQEQKSLELQEAELLASNPQFAEFLKAQQAFKQRSEVMWASIEQGMVKNNIKSIKGDWGYITLAQRTNYKADLATLPAKFLKKVPDVKAIGDYHKLRNKLPPGVTPEVKMYLMKKIK